MEVIQNVDKLSESVCLTNCHYMLIACWLSCLYWPANCHISVMGGRGSIQLAVVIWSTILFSGDTIASICTSRVISPFVRTETSARIIHLLNLILCLDCLTPYCIETYSFIMGGEALTRSLAITIRAASAKQGKCAVRFLYSGEESWLPASAASIA